MKDKYIVRQDDLTDCGVSCLLSIIRYYDGNVSKEYLRDLTHTTKDGVSAYDLIEAAHEIGFNSYGLNGEVADIENNSLPMIAHVIIDDKCKHFVVIYSINHRNRVITLMDPSVGYKKISFDEWMKISTNNYIYFKPKKVIPKLDEENKVKLLIKEFIINHKESFIFIFCLSLIYVFFNIITSYQFKILLNDLSYNVNNSLTILFILIIFIMIKKIINLFRNNILNYLNCFLEDSLVLDSFSHIINLPYLYYKNRTTGDVLTRISDLTNVKEFISQLFLSIFVDVFLVVFVLIFLFNINVLLTILSIIMITIYSLISILNSKNITRKVRSYYQESSHLNSYLNESISNIDTIKGMNIEKYVVNNIKVKSNKKNNASYNLFNTLNKEMFIKDILYEVIMVILLFIGIKRVSDNNLSIANLITFTTLLNYFTDPIKNVVNLNLLYQNAKESLRRISELYLIPKDDLKMNTKFVIERFKGDIVFKNVSYSYDSNINVINKLNLEIKHGERVFIHGESGTGKSTLVKLLTKYLNGYKGKIYIDDIELSNISLYDIRTKICYISQKEGLFNDTVYNNIVLDKEINYKNFLKIVKLSLIDDFVENNENGYNLVLEENGFNISGGERQRIILARSLLKDSDIYILDESLNAIDIERERIILKNIFKYLKGKTIIVISHRFDNSDLFDKKIKVEKGVYECYDNWYIKSQWIKWK